MPLSLSLSLSLFPLTAEAAPDPADPLPHHIVVIVLDCVGIEAMPDYNVEGNAQAETPEITDDIWKGHGVRFDRAWALPTCSPTRASTLTGRFPFRHGIGRQIDPGGVAFVSPSEPGSEETIAEILRSQVLPNIAYRTGAFGKWHLSNQTTLLEGDNSAPHNLGFDHFEGEMFQVSENYYVQPEAARWTKYVSEGEMVLPPEQPQDGEYLIHQQVADATEFFRQSVQADSSRPVFIWLALQAPFENHQRPPDDSGPIQFGYDDGNLTFPGNTQSGDVAADPSDYIPCFDATLQAADTEIGNLLQAITDETEAPWWQSTTVFLFGDNGTPANAIRAPFTDLRAKGTLFEGGIRAPFYMSGRSVLVAPGTTDFSPVQVIDVFQTILDITGFSTAMGRPIDSVSLLPLVDGSGMTSVHDWLYSERFDANYETGLPRSTGDDRVGWRSDVSGDWKLFYTPGTPALEVLYDLTQDPWEKQSPVIPLQVGNPNNALYLSEASTLRNLIDGLIGNTGQ